MEDKVVDSRVTGEGASIRRRRECLACGQRFTTFERVEQSELRVLKRSGDSELFQPEKVLSGLIKALKNRPVSESDIQRLADEVEQEIRDSGQPEIASEDLAIAILNRLRELDQVGYVRFASVAKRFTDLTDFEKELDQLLIDRTSEVRESVSTVLHEPGDKSWGRAGHVEN